MYALVEFSGKQFRVEEGCTIKVPYIDSKVGSKVPIDNIIYLSRFDISPLIINFTLYVPYFSLNSL